MNLKRIISLSILFISISLILPLYLLPLISDIAGFKMFRGIYGVQIYIEVVVIPIPIFVTSDSYTLVGFFISGLTAILYLLYRDRIKMSRVLKKQSIDLIPLVTSYVKTGMPVLDALSEAGKVLGNPINIYITKFVELTKLGYSPEHSFEISFSDIPRDVRVSLAAIAISMGSGGRVTDILLTAERYVFHISRLDELRKHRLEGYKAVLILAIIAFAISAILSLTILSYISKALYLSGLAIDKISLPLTSTMYYIPAIIIVVASSIAISRIVYGETAIAFKYIAILSPVISIIFAAAVHLL
jgi:hypothetical protein